MGIKQESELLQSILIQAINRLTEAQIRANQLFDRDPYEAPTKIGEILEISYEALSNLQAGLAQIELITRMFGEASGGDSKTQSILGSIIFPTISLANTSADSSMISSIITDLTKNPLAYKAIPWLQMLGDSGELVLWKILLDSEGKDKLDWSEVEIKPKLKYDPAKKTFAQPDFYIPSRNLICDAKAWQPADIDKGKKSSVEINPKSLKKAASKYAKCLKDGGEVRLYFPEDTYYQQKKRLDLLSSEVQSEFSNVKINMLPMPGVTHKDLTRQTQFRITLFKWLASAKK
jgi:hypothetical protein